jgi:hypothetical protein
MPPAGTIPEGSAIPPSQDAPLVAFLTRIEVKLDTSLTRGEDHESRIRGLERKVFVAAGAATVLGASLGQLANVLLK